RGSVSCQLAAIGVRAQIILGNVAEHLHRLSPDIQRVLFLFRQIQQPSPRRLFILVTGDQDRGILLRSEAGRVPRAWSAGKHATAADDTRRRTSEDPLA